MFEILTAQPRNTFSDLPFKVHHCKVAHWLEIANYNRWIPDWFAYKGENPARQSGSLPCKLTKWRCLLTRRQCRLHFQANSAEETACAPSEVTFGRITGFTNRWYGLSCPQRYVVARAFVEKFADNLGSQRLSATGVCWQAVSPALVQALHGRVTVRLITNLSLKTKSCLLVWN